METTITTDELSKHTKYQYQPLPGPTYIRLISLQPAQDPSDPLICELIPHRLDDTSRTFEAISYTWGPPVFPEHLFCSIPASVDSKGVAHVAITANLAAALGKFRLLDRPRDIWADAVCINQCDITERNTQVAMMGQVYRAASTVLVWLGEADSETVAALNFCKMLAAELPACGLDISDPFRTPKIDTLEAQATRTRLARDTDLQAGGRAYRNLVSRPWFSRRWIIQEVYQARRIVLYVGTQEVDWETFSLSMAVTMRLRRDPHAGFTVLPLCCGAKVVSKKLQSPWSLARQIAVGRHYGPNGASVEKWEEELFSLIRAYSTSDCSDERDVLYALKSMRKDTWLKVDYAHSVEEVYINFTIGLIENSKTYAVLHNASRENSPVRDTKELNLPTWVPDWKRMRYGRNLGGYTDKDAGFFQAGKEEPASYRFSDDRRELTMQGYYVGKLHSHSWEVLSKLRNYSKRRDEFRAEADAVNVEDARRNRVKQDVAAVLKWLELYDTYVVTDGCASIENETKLQPFALTLIAGNKLNVTQYVLRKDVSPEEITKKAAKVINVAMDDDYHSIDESDRIAGNDYFTTCMQVCLGRTFFIIESDAIAGAKRSIGIGPQGMIRDDVVVVFSGAETPFVLRPLHQDDQTKYRLIGQCFVYGVMNGEALRRDNIQKQEFTLI